MSDEMLCNNCHTDLTDPKNAGFLYGGEWYCSGMCAELAAGFWHKGEQVQEYNASLANTQ